MTVAASFWAFFKWLIYLTNFQHKKKKKKPKQNSKKVEKSFKTSSITLTWAAFVCNH